MDKIEKYVSSFSKEDPLLRTIREQSDKHREKHGCDVHPSDPVTGRFLDVLVRATGARRVLEVGCGLGYSGIWLARALPPGGRIETVEQDPLHAKMASENFKLADVRSRVRLLKGDAKSVLSGLEGPYDFIFEDATFGGRPEHYEDLISVLRVGGTILFANWFPIEPAIAGGTHLQVWKRKFPQSDYAPARTRRFVEKVFRDRRLSVVLLPYIWKGIATKIKG